MKAVSLDMYEKDAVPQSSEEHQTHTQLTAPALP